MANNIMNILASLGSFVNEVGGGFASVHVHVHVPIEATCQRQMSSSVDLHLKF